MEKNKLTNWEFLLFGALLGFERMVENKGYDEQLNNPSTIPSFLDYINDKKEMAQQMLCDTLGYGING